jgi:hypothetical protein
VTGQAEVEWFSYPATKTSPGGEQKPIFGVVDSHHILCNIRTKCCSSGIGACNINQKAWVKIAEAAHDNKIGLTTAHVSDLVDRQNNAFACLTFSKQVEEEMLKNGDFEEAKFCNLVRNWYASDDEAGIDCVSRTDKRFAMRSWLLNKYNPLQFPPPSNFVKGIPIVTFECLLTNIERKTQIYAFVKGASYNARSLTTLDVENFFSILSDIVPGGSAGLAIRLSQIPSSLKATCEIMMLQMKPHRYTLIFLSGTLAPNGINKYKSSSIDFLILEVNRIFEFV